MQNQTCSTWSIVAVLATTLFAGCSGDPEYEPSQREDTNTITLPADNGIEFKLYMRQADPMQYTWRSTQRIVFDFHGEVEGDTSGAFTSHKTGTASSDSGALEAPFTGTHGWYWENRNAQSVTITLTTDGVYDVVGETAPFER